MGKGLNLSGSANRGSGLREEVYCSAYSTQNVNPEILPPDPALCDQQPWIGVMTAASGLPSFTTALYATVSIFPGLGYVALWIQIRSQSAAPAHASLGKQIASVSLYLTAIPATYYRPAASLALIGIVAVLWLLPPKARVPRGKINANLRGGQVASPRNPLFRRRTRGELTVAAS